MFARTHSRSALFVIVALCLVASMLISATPAATTDGGPSPINIFITLHIDPPRADPATGIISLPPGFYERTRDEILWLIDEADEHGAKYTALFNGYYPQEALARDELAPFQALLDTGHEIGTHAHTVTYDDVQGVWLNRYNETGRYGVPTYDRTVTEEVWGDARYFVDQALTALGLDAAALNQTMCAVPFLASDEGELMDMFGFSIASGNRSEKGVEYFGHLVWNPFRVAQDDTPGHELEEDLTTAYVTLDHYAQIGKEDAHGMDLTVPQLQRHFLELYVEWLAAARNGSGDRVWTFGLNIHPNYGDQYNDAIVEFLDWLDANFVGQTTPEGYTIARYATAQEIAAEFEAWETEHAGQSSFNYVAGDPYPYTYELIAQRLDGAAYAYDVDLGPGVTAYRFNVERPETRKASESHRVFPAGRLQRSPSQPPAEGERLYLAWSDTGPRTVDFSAEIGGWVQITNMDGTSQIVPATTVPLTEQPVFVELPSAPPPTSTTTLQLPHDVDRLPDGHTLITDGGQRPGVPRAGQPGTGSQIIEVDADGNVVWSYKLALSWAHNADRLPNGNTLISDTGHDRVIEIDAAGTIVWNSDAITLSDGSTLNYPNDANALPGGRLLITDRNNHRVIEIERDGTIVWQFGETGVPGSDTTHLNGPHNADRLPSGNTIVADSNNERILEIAPDGTIVWQYPPASPHEGRRPPTEPLSPRSETFGDQERSPAPLLPSSLAPLPLDWPRDADRLSNGNTLITDSRNNRIIEVTPAGQIVWEYGSLDFPYDADRLPDGNTLIADSLNHRVIEVDATGAIVWQYPPPPTGTIAGTVRDTGGQPVSGATVTVFGTELSDTTDADGQYAITDVPVAAPRYIVTVSKAGYFDAQAGDIDVTEDMTTTVDFTLEAGIQVTETLYAMIGYIVYRDPSSEVLIPPPTAVLSPTLYPAEVRPYLQPGQYIESDDPAIVAVAQSILAGLTPEERTQQTTVAHAVYAWMVQNIEYDLVRNYPGDVTAGNWQTTYGAWGHSFADWAYTAREVLEEGRGICIEHARLATALLRAVGIPARPAPLMAHPVTQWWVQLPDGSGFWANMDTSIGRSEYTRSGDLWAKFPSKEEHNLGFWAINADGPIHMDWWTDNPCVWREEYGTGRRYPATAEGLADAQAALAYFAEHGQLPPPSGPLPQEDEPYYQLSIRGFEVDLTNAREQTRFEVSFTLATESDYVQRVDQTHWTNHPDWVTRTWLETETDPTTGESLTSYHIELDRGHRLYLPLVLR